MSGVAVTNYREHRGCIRWRTLPTCSTVQWHVSKYKISCKRFPHNLIMNHISHYVLLILSEITSVPIYEGWNFNSGNYLFTTDTK